MATTHYEHRKAAGTSYLPENTKTRSIIPSSQSGVGFRSKYNPEWAAVIDQATFEKEIKEVCLSDVQVNSICYKVYQAKKQEANKSITTGTYNMMTLALALIVLSVVCTATFCYIETLYTYGNAPRILLYSTCSAAGVV